MIYSPEGTESEEDRDYRKELWSKYPEFLTNTHQLLMIGTENVFLVHLLVVYKKNRHGQCGHTHGCGERHDRLRERELYQVPE